MLMLVDHYYDAGARLPINLCVASTDEHMEVCVG